MARTPSPRFVILAVATPFLVALLGFLLGGLAAGMGGGVVTALIEQVGQRRLNPLMAGVLGLAPVLLLLLILWIAPRFLPRLGWGAPAGWAGLAPIAILELWAHWEVWTTYLPTRSMPGFPHGLELVIVPLFFAPVGMTIGLGVALWLGPGAAEAGVDARGAGGGA